MLKSVQWNFDTLIAVLGTCSVACAKTLGDSKDEQKLCYTVLIQMSNTY